MCGMKPYREIKLYNKPKMGQIMPLKKIPEGIALLLVIGIIVVVILFATTKSGLTKRSEWNNIKVQKTRSFTARKPKVYRSTDVDMDPLRISSPYYTMQIANNSRCKERLPMFSELKLPKTALVSYPGSGSTWVRHIVQQLTGT